MRLTYHNLVALQIGYDVIGGAVRHEQLQRRAQAQHLHKHNALVDARTKISYDKMS